MVAKKPRVVIVGAGMAGLTAANRLHTAASGNLFDLCVIEGGDRIGGRILTSEFAENRIELGATWIQGIGGSPIYAIAENIGAFTYDSYPWERMDGFPSDRLTIAEGGLLVDPSLVVKPISSLYRQLMDSAREGEANVDPKEPGVGPYLRRGLQEYRASSDRTIGGDGGWTMEALEDAVFAMHENGERVDTSANHLKELDLAAESEYQDYPGDHITIAKGYSTIIDYLAAVLPPGMIRFGRRISRIEWCPDGAGGGDGGPVRVHFEGDHPAMAADHVIITVSLGVLKAGLSKGGGQTGGLAFSPGLPPSKRDAILRLGFGVVDKLFMEMDNRSCSGKGKFPFLQMAFAQRAAKENISTEIPRWMRRTASICPIYRDSSVLLAWFTGTEALELEDLDDEEILRGIHATLDAFLSASSSGAGEVEFGRRCDGSYARTGPRIARVKRSGWGKDPLFMGSYSYVAVGSSGDDLDLMAEPLPQDKSDSGPKPPPLQILFAGEATHRTHYSTTHGAYLSGIREANRLLQNYHLTTN